MERKLSSGIRVLLAERHDFPGVSLAFVLDRGTCDGGVAASLYAAALGSSPGQSRRENLGYLHDVAARVHLNVTDDGIIVSTSVLPPLVASAVSRLAPMVLAPGLLDDDLAHARHHWKQRLSVAGTRQDRLAERVLRGLLFGRGGYGNVVVDASEVDATSDSQVRAFRKASLSPRHVTVVAAGAITPDTLAGLLERYTNDLPRGDVGVSTCAGSPTPSNREGIHVIDEPGAEQSRVHIGAVGVPAGHVDGPALDVLSAALGASLSSRLNLKVREEHGLSYGVRMRSQEWRTSGLVEISTSVETARTADALKGLLSELDRAAIDPLEGGELRRAKVLALPDVGAQRDEVSSIIWLGLYGRPTDAFALWSRAITSSTADDVTRLAAKYLPSSRRAVTIVGDARKISAALEELGGGHVVVER